MSEPASFRALCAELVEGIERHVDCVNDATTFSALLESARAALAAPRQGALSDDDELRGIFYKHCDSGDDGPAWIECEQFIVAVRDAIARCAAQAVPVAVVASDEEALWAAYGPVSWSCLVTDGQPHGPPAPGCVALIPVFASEQEARDWAGSDADVVRLDNQQ